MFPCFGAWFGFARGTVVRRSPVAVNRNVQFAIVQASSAPKAKWGDNGAAQGAAKPSADAVELREYFIPDFLNWQEHDQFEAVFPACSKTFADESVAKA